MRNKPSSVGTVIVDAFYSFAALPLFWVVMQLYALFNYKARRRRELSSQTRRDTHSKVRNQQTEVSQKRIWFHAASMGEYEQLVPIITQLKRTDGNAHIIVTLFSPSGIDAARSNADVDVALILPFDWKRTVHDFIDRHSPTILVVDRYDMWRNCIVACDQRDIPITLVNATYPSGASFAFLRSWFADTYKRCTYISAVTPADAHAIEQLTGAPVDVLPDTRVDRILDRISDPDPSITAFQRSDVVTLVAGSTWPQEEEILIDSLKSLTELNASSNRGIRVVIVPHEPTEQALRRIEQRITCTRLSAANSTTRGHLLVDSTGKLLSLYAIADAAFVGGGFGDGVHSVTEPAGYGVPIACGPRIERSRDANDLLQSTSLTIIRNTDDFKNWIRSTVVNEEQRRISSAISKQLISERSGSSVTICNVICAIIEQHSAS